MNARKTLILMVMEEATLYQDPLHYDLMAQMTAPDDLPFYLRLFEERAGSVLELECGTGRLTLPIAARGYETWGMDNAMSLISHAMGKAEAAGIKVTLLNADLRGFNLERTFDYLIIANNAFNHLVDLSSIVECLSSVKYHMHLQSRLIIDTFNPDPVLLCGGKERKILDYTDPDSQEQVKLKERNEYDAASQVRHITWRYDFGGQPNARVDEMDLRVFFPQELDALLTLCDLEIVEKYGSYNRQPFGANSHRQIVMCRLR